MLSVLGYEIRNLLVFSVLELWDQESVSALSSRL